MKLHRIEATNLNSLFDLQEVDLDEDLRGASLFLIQGPTGSGKSTLMDAVSLALFGTTPRLEHLGGEKAVADQIMSRGAGTAQAVVVFSKREPSGQRVRYRATWSAKRAWGKHDGTVQNTVRGLERQEPDGTWALLVSDHRNKFVQPVFDEVLEGFTPQDFQRSMLLAQGRFDAMLRANPEERAAILERLTDTGIYQQLGDRAARMRGAWEGRLAGLRATRDAIGAVPEEEIRAARETVDEGALRVHALERRLERLAACRSWLLTEAKLVEDLADTERGLAAVAAREAEATEILANLLEHERCAEAFAALDQRGLAVRRIEANRAEQSRVQGTLPELEAEVGRAGKRVEAAEAALRAAETALSGLRDPAADAGSAAHALGEARREVDDARIKANRAVQGADQQAKALSKAEERLTEAARIEAEALATFEAVDRDAPLVAALPTLSEDAAAVVEASEALRRDRASHDAQVHQVAERHQKLAAAREAQERVRAEQLAPLQERADLAVAAVVAHLGDGDPDEALEALRATHLAALERCTALDRARAAVDARDAEAEQVVARRTALEKASVGIGAAEQAHRDREAEAQQHAGALEAASAALVPLERIAALGTQRAELEEGTPCPLCGSEAHPFLHDAAKRAQAQAIEEEVRRAREHRDQAQARLQEATTRVSEAKAAVAGAQAAHEAAQIALAEAERDANAARRRAAEALGAAGLEDEAPIDTVLAAAQEATTRAGALKQQLSEAQEAVRAGRQAEQALAAAERALREQADRIAQEAARLEQAGEELRARDEALESSARSLQARRAALGEALAAFGIVAEPAENGVAEARWRAGRWTSARDAAQAATNARQTADADRSSREEALKTARAAAKDAADELARREAALQGAAVVHERATEALRVAWQLAIGSDDADVARPAFDAGPMALVKSQERRVQMLGEALTARVQARATAETALTEASATLRTLADQAEALTAELDRADEILGAALAQLGLPDADALVARRLPTGDLAASRQVRDALREDRSRAEAAVLAAGRQLGRHRADRPDDLPHDTSVEALAEAATEADASLATERQAIADADAVLARARQQSEAVARAERALKEGEGQAAVWLKLHELIGVGDGKKFKLFAQALNLGQLLQRANRHLVHLNDRYRLRPETDPKTGLPTLEFVVEDRWRPGTLRSLATLSGGESFLVSLALALGLSDLRTSSMPVETLLLDEGFGTLDRQTLATALAALQQLQAAGRQIGIISHVAGLQENIEAQILVEPIGEGRSRVRPHLAGAALPVLQEPATLPPLQTAR